MCSSSRRCARRTSLPTRIWSSSGSHSMVMDGSGVGCLGWVGKRWKDWGIFWPTGGGRGRGRGMGMEGSRAMRGGDRKREGGRCERGRRRGGARGSGAPPRETRRIGGNRAPSTFAGSTPGLGFYRVRYRVSLHPVQELGSAKFTGPECYAVAHCSQP
jgi:hypothetical protein